MKIGIKSLGAYLPYNYLSRAAINRAWGSKGGKGEKSVADVDEDSLTLAVEAAMSCFRFIEREKIDTLYFASTTGAYAEKSHSALISVACDLNDESMFTVDFAASTRAGTNAMKAALDAAAGNSNRNILVAAADVRNAFPKSPLENSFGDGSAALVIGSGNDLLAEVEFFTSVNEEINDYWRNAGEKYTRHSEGRFCDEEGYLREVKIILNKLQKNTGTMISEFEKVVLTAQNTKLQVKIAEKFAIAPEKLVDTLLVNVGDTGAAQALIGIVNALENAKAGDRILVVDYGNGANAMVLKVTENITKISDFQQIQRYLEKRVEMDSYVKFLSWRDIAAAEPGGAFKLPASSAQTWREQNINLRLHGSVCKKCSSVLYPVARICDNCGSKDEYDEVRLSDHICKLYTYCRDEYAGRSDSPVIIQAVAEDPTGCHVYMIMTDCRQDEIKAGMNLEFSFRKMHELGNFPNYFWKVRPLRREKV